MIKFHKTNIYKIHLYSIQNVYEEGSLKRILFPIGHAIENCEKNIDDAESTNCEDYIESVVDSEVEIIESLLGTAFIACQPYITGMVSKIISLHKFHNKSGNKNKLITTGDNKYEILLFGDKPNNIKYTKVQLIDSFANYFKHREEWNHDWETEKKKEKESKRTIEIITSGGLCSGNSANLRTASKVLGNLEYKNTIIFYDIINNWCKSLYAEYNSELKNLNLI